MIQLSRQFLTPELLQPGRQARVNSLYIIDRDDPSAKNLDLWWLCNEGSGYFLRELCRGNHGDLVSNPGWTSYKFGGVAVDLDGTSDYGNTQFDPDIAANASFSISLWFKADSITSGGINTLFASLAERSGSSDPFILLQFDGQNVGNGRVRFSVRDNGGGGADAVTADSTNTYNDSEWHHAVGVYDGATGTASLYLDGAVDGTGTNANSKQAKSFSGYPFYIGARNNRGSAEKYFDGAITDIRFYNSALSEGDIRRVCDGHYPLRSVVSFLIVPAAVSGVEILPPATDIAFAAQVPAIGTGAIVSVPATDTALAALAPAVGTGENIQPPVTDIALAGLAPAIGTGENIQPPATNIALAMLVPSIGVSTVVDVPSTDIALATLAPTIQTGTNVQVPATDTVLAALAPDVAAGVNLSIPATDIALQALAPDVGIGITITVPATDFALAALAPDVAVGKNIEVPVTSIALEGQAPIIAAGVNLSIPVGNIDLAGLAPSFIGADSGVPVVEITFDVATREIKYTVGGRDIKITTH